MVLILYGHANSTCAKAVAQVLLEKEVPFKWVAVDLANGENKTPEFLAKNPFCQVPLLEDPSDGYIIYESRAICRYIAEKYAGQGRELIPFDVKKRGIFEQACSIEMCSFDVHANALIHEMVINKYLGLPSDEARARYHITQLEKKLDVYEQILSKQKYLAGDELTLADIFHLPVGVLLPAAGSNAILERPNVARWFKGLEDMPSWQAVKDGDLWNSRGVRMVWSMLCQLQKTYQGDSTQL